MANPTPPKGRTRAALPAHDEIATQQPPGDIIDLDDADDEDYGETPPSGALGQASRPGPQMATPRLPKHGNRVAEPKDRLRDDPDGRRRNARKKRAQEVMRNPFLDDDEPAMPRLPADCEEWAYAWKRHQIEGKDDRRNMQSATAGRLAWEVFRIDDIPAEDQQRLRALLQVEGRYDGCLVYNDCVGMRTSRVMRDMKREAEDIRATRQIQATRQQFTNAKGADELGTWIEEDKTQIVERISG